jgi:hypothetical protein
LHPHRSADKERLEIQSFFAIKAFEMSDPELQLGYGNGVVEKRIFLSCDRAGEEARIRNDSVKIPMTVFCIVLSSL